MSDYQSITPRILEELREALSGAAVRADEAAIEQYGRDETENLHFPPEVVVIPETTEQVSALMRFCTEHRIPVTPRGGGTGLSGGALPVCGGVSLSLEKFSKIRKVDTGNLTMEVESGVTIADIHAAAEEVNLFYPPDPSSQASCFIGGNIAEDAAGPRSCKYGPTRQWILGLEAVLPGGKVIRTGGGNRKDVTGYNLTQLLVGSEGTLAIVTAATLKLIPLPKHTVTLAVPFAALDTAAEAVQAIFREGFTPAAVEILEENALKAVEEVHEVPPQLSGKEALLFIEFDGADAEDLLEQAAALGEMLEKLGAGEILAAQEAGEQRRLWDVRKKVGEAVKHRSVYKEADTVVPRSRLADSVRAARAAAEKHGLTAICYGHAADGNLHVNILRGDLSDEEWIEKRDATERELFAKVLELGGRISGEHGIGWVQRDFLPMAFDEGAIALMKRIKQSFDPLGILNPRKIFPDQKT